MTAGEVSENGQQKKRQDTQRYVLQLVGYVLATGAGVSPELAAAPV
jgi:hypothetical protein